MTRRELLQRGIRLTLLARVVKGYGQSSPCHSQSNAVDPDQEKYVECLSRAEKSREKNLSGYTSEEIYKVYRRHHHSGPAATRTVSVVYVKGQGKTYTEISRTGSAEVQKFLLDRLLHEESALSRPGVRERALITADNYDILLKCKEKVSGRDFVRLGISPKQKTKYVVEGDVLIDADTCHLVRVEGKLAKSPNFFVSAPSVTRNYSDKRDYSDKQTFFLAASAMSAADSVLLGQTEVLVSYTYPHIG